MKPFPIPPLVPELLVQDIHRSLRFYREVLDFGIEYQRAENNFAMISLEGSWIMLEQTDSIDSVSDQDFVDKREWRTGRLEHPFGRGINFQLIVSNIAAHYDKVCARGYPVKFPLEERWYRAGEVKIGVKQFLVMDPDGYLLRLQQAIGIESSSS